MALLAESLVDEWLNRNGFFTMRGLKHGVHEIDLLGVRPSGDSFEAWHVEVQASFRPIGYICPLIKDYVPDFAKSRTSAKARPKKIISPCVKAWVEKKYKSSAKVKARNSIWPNLQWQFFLVHGIVREPAELAIMQKLGVTTIPLHEVLGELEHMPGKITGGAGTDLAELIEYYKENTGQESVAGEI